MNPSILAAPIAIPLFFAALQLVLPGSLGIWQPRLRRIISGLALLANLIVAIMILTETLSGRRIVMQMGLWPAPFGITLLADGLTGIMLAAVALLSAVIFPFSAVTINQQRERLGFFTMSLILLMGVNGALVTGDLFNLYVFYEVLLMSSFVLLTLGGAPGQINGGIRYVVLNLMGSIMLLLAAGITYGTLGTLNMAQIAQRMDIAPPAVQWLIGGLLLLAFAGKAAVFPVFFWLPSSYHTPHPAVTALFSGTLTKVGIYSLLRTFPLFFPHLLQEWQPLLLTLAGLTMVIGVLGAFAQPTIRRLLSFHIISQIGYMLMALALALEPTGLGVAFGLGGALLFVLHNMLVKTALLLGGGAVELEMGTGKLDELGGQVQRRPVLATIFFIAAFSLAGFPPSSGFIGKLALLQLTVETQQWLITGVSVFVSLLTTMSMIRLWQYMFWGKPGPRLQPLTRFNNRRSHFWTTLPPALLVTASLLLGIFAQPVLETVNVAARQAADRQGYIDAVAPQQLVQQPQP